MVNKNKKYLLKNLKKDKSGFAFSFMALFLSFLIFTFASYYLFEGSYSKNDSFKESRINAVNNEFRYFRDVYVKDILKFSSFNTIYALSSSKNNIGLINNNYSRLNSLVYEGILNGSFMSVKQDLLINKSLNFFLKEYSNSFYSNQLANISFEILALNIYEEKPYFLSIDFKTKTTIVSIDNFSNFYKIENFKISFPTYTLFDPQSKLFENKNISIKSSSLYSSSDIWSISTLNETLNNSYSNIYEEPNYKYNLGNSFLKKLLNFSDSSYNKVLGFWSFDYDEDELKVYDTSGVSPFVKHFGNSRLLFNFDNSSINKTTNQILDLSSYNILANISSTTNCSSQGIFSNACSFNGIDSNLNISNNDFNLNTTNKITISTWVFPKSLLSSTGGPAEFFRYGGGILDVIDLRISTSGFAQMEIGNHNGGVYGFLNSNSKVLLNRWSYIVGTYDGNSGEIKIYINGVLNSKNIISPLNNFIKSNNNIGIGNYLPSLNEGFNGSIDELGVYSKVLTKEKISKLYFDRKSKFIDYVDGLHGLAIDFDGVDDYIYLDDKNKKNSIFDDEIISRTGEFWFKTYNASKFQMIYEEGGQDNGINLFINNSKIISGVYSKLLGFNGVWISSPIKENTWIHAVYVFDSINSNLKLYLNGELVNSSNLVLSKISGGHTDDDAIGRISGNTLINGNINFGPAYFYGLIDEVKFYNRTLKDFEIKYNYFNYDSMAKGSANYLTAFNSNRFGYNTNSFSKKIPYSSKIFYDYYKNGGNLNPNRFNITTYSIVNITSNSFNNNYYNFLVGPCMLDAYSVLGYGINIANIENFGIYNNSCVNLIKEGIY